MALTDSLIGVWCEASDPTTDESGNGETLTNNNSVGTTTGVVGTAATFTAASSQYLNHADDASLSTGDIDFTLQAWVYITTKTDFSTIIAKRESPEFVLVYRSSSDTFQAYFGANLIGTSLPDNSAPALNTWALVHFWHDSVNNLIGISINAGTPVTASDNSAGFVDGNGTFNIGRDPAFGQYWDGRINQVAMWKRVLTSDERTTLYNGGSGLAFTSWSGGSVPIIWNIGPNAPVNDGNPIWLVGP